MKAIGEVIFYLAVTVFVGNVAFNKIYQQTKKEALTKVHQGHPS
jgi:hypothetical protein